MEDYSTSSFLQSFTRFSGQVGYPHKLLTDEGGQLVKAFCPVGGHNHHGRVERKIQAVKSSLEKSMHQDRLSIIQWETIAAGVANSINDMPIAVRNVKGNFEMADLITPNRLLLGRNNNRGPSGTLSVQNDFDKILRANQKIHDAWFDCWLVSHVPNLIEHPKWFKTSTNMKAGDIVLFTKQDSVLSSTYQYGIVKSVINDRDNKVRKVVVEYQNGNENVKRVTTRSNHTSIVLRTQPISPSFAPDPTSSP
ncbi:uncharacterized protein [Clytia hemisphaerica]|uniref:uncharacterized protein n=1 Tax=Clytia hemisphaerica TaxID=252671 RepID=UPI0034D47E0A